MPKSINAEPVKLDWLDVQDLAAHVLGLDPDDYEDVEIENLLYEKFFKLEDGAFNAFQKLIEHLIPSTDVGESQLTNDYFRGFTRDFGGGTKTWLIKHKIVMPKTPKAPKTPKTPDVGGI